MQTRTMNILIVDDEPLAITRLQNLLRSHPGVEIIGTAKTADEARKKIINLKPDVVLIDVEIGNATGYEVIEAVDKTSFRPKYVVITAFSHYAINGIRNRVDDYLLKPVDLAELKAALDRITHNRFQSNHIEILVTTYHLTKRELQVLAGIMEGKTSREIAGDLNLSKHTVDTFRRKILKKTGVRSTGELILKKPI